VPTDDEARADERIPGDRALLGGERVAFAEPRGAALLVERPAGRQALRGADRDARIPRTAAAQVIGAAGGCFGGEPERRILSVARQPAIAQCKAGIADVRRRLAQIELDAAIANVAHAEAVAGDVGTYALWQAEDVVPAVDERVERARADVADRQLRSQCP